MNTAFRLYKNFFLKHENKIFISLGSLGSVGGAHLGYNDTNFLITSNSSRYINTFTGTLIGGTFGLGTALLLEPSIVPCSIISGFVYLANKSLGNY